MDGIDRNVVSPNLFNPAWGDLANVVYNPDLIWEWTLIFLPEAVLSSTYGCSKDRSILVEQLQETLSYLLPPSLLTLVAKNYLGTYCRGWAAATAVQGLVVSVGGLWIFRTINAYVLVFTIWVCTDGIRAVVPRITNL